MKTKFKAVLASAKKGNAEDALFVSYLYDTGKGIEKSPDKAMLWLYKAAGLGNAEAKSMIEQIEIHPVASKKFELALAEAEKGDSTSALMVSFCYDTGLGVKQDGGLAHTWLVKAAELGSPDAVETLAKTLIMSKSTIH